MEKELYMEIQQGIKLEGTPRETHVLEILCKVRRTWDAFGTST